MCQWQNPPLRKAAEAGNSDAMNNLGVLLQQRGELDEAERWWRQADSMITRVTECPWATPAAG